MFDLLKLFKRRNSRTEAFPAEWEEILRSNASHYRRLPETSREKLRSDAQLLIADRDWEGCGGLQMTDEIRVTIAGQACLLTLGFEGEPYPNVSTILVYPTGYLAPEKVYRPGGIVEEYKSHRLGEAWSHGPLIISWADALAGGRGEAGGHNVVFHEFAHKLDMRSGPANGVPQLLSDEQYRAWEQVMSSEFAQLVAQSDAGEATLLDQYGATNGAEFFAVATECFFMQPVEMREQHPRLFGVLRDYFRQDPTGWSV